MVPWWVLFLVTVFFVSVVVALAINIREMLENAKTLSFYLDQYISKYGPSIDEECNGCFYEREE